ncbi:MAG TPA: hypothetical protein VMH22_05155 [bacterium]|nr:hypothetical protein [bacterium]
MTPSAVEPSDGTCLRQSIMNRVGREVRVDSVGLNGVTTGWMAL